MDCVFGCNGADRCKTPRPNEFVIHNAFDGGPTDPRWPSPLIPVCWTEPNDIELASVRDAIRLKIDSTFGRTTALGFTGWGACLNGEARVELSFVDDCTGERARIQRIGYPGPGESLSVELCKSYYGTAAPAVSKPVEADLLPYLAMHVFGHVVGLEDVAYGQGLTDVMMKAFEWPAPGTYRLKTFRRPKIASVVRREATWFARDPRRSVPRLQCRHLFALAVRRQEHASVGAPRRNPAPRDVAVLAGGPDARQRRIRRLQQRPFASPDFRPHQLADVRGFSA